jgi:hypothetical protein
MNIAIYKHLLQNGLNRTAKRLLKETKLVIGKDQEIHQYSLTATKKRNLPSPEKPKEKKQKKEFSLPEKPAEKNENSLKEIAQQKKFFQRVDPTKVEFLDERLRTNDFVESKSSSYGERAYKDLSSARGSDFKKEKNKKKKGTYSGGQIDTSKVHSIKFCDD